MLQHTSLLSGFLPRAVVHGAGLFFERHERAERDSATLQRCKSPSAFLKNGQNADGRGRSARDENDAVGALHWPLAIEGHSTFVHLQTNRKRFDGLKSQSQQA